MVAIGSFWSKLQPFMVVDVGDRWTSDLGLRLRGSSAGGDRRSSDLRFRQTDSITDRLLWNKLKGFRVAQQQRQQQGNQHQSLYGFIFCFFDFQVIEHMDLDSAVYIRIYLLKGKGVVHTRSNRMATVEQKSWIGLLLAYASCTVI
ncbi:hypothetical protein L1987_47529 [Smallanthus sonchifolius]|uniref:Uncharacterized protein n=1 Tax=Smallanthus sonchifolius TaxID=185202 RepID=A0ACB9G2V0_9ASTR|nr:hypothetical protein L1987_47529 [Smallanthus sonchifolius]